MSVVCVFHHVPLAERTILMTEVKRVMKPGGVLAIIEHNPYNPATRLIVSRTPVDADAILLRPAQTRRLFQSQGLHVDDQRYFLYFPETMYQRARGIEAALSWFPLGGQYVMFGRK